MKQQIFVQRTMLSLIFQMKIRRSEVQSSSGPKNKKNNFVLIFNIFVCVFLFCLIFWGIKNILSIKFYFAHLIKERTVLRQALWVLIPSPHVTDSRIQIWFRRSFFFKVFL